MRRRIVWFGICLLLVGQALAQAPRILQQVEDTAACRKWVEAQMSRMTLKQKIGQLFIHTVAPIQTAKNKANIMSAVREYGVGGLLFSGGELERQVQLTNMAQELADIPLLITFDGEWGLAMRLKETPSFPRNRFLGCIQSDSLLYEYGREVARQLKLIGVQVNFAPVADIDNNPDNPVINTRSFGSVPENVARKVIAYSHGLEDGGVLAVCKHFPGHGDTDVDSHKKLPVLNFDRSRLDSIELYPFRQAVNAGIGGVMVGHLQVPQIGRKPASISPALVRDLLKKELGFTGLVFTDALEMKGISGNEGVCAQALRAGNDLLLAPRNLKRELDYVLDAVKAGKLTEADIDEHCRRVLAYKYALGLSQRPAPIPSDVRKRIETASMRRLNRHLSNASVTVLKNEEDMLPLDLSLSGTVLLSLSPTLAQGYPFYKRLREVIPVNWVRADVDSLDSVEKILRPAQQVIIAIHEKDVAQYASLVEALAADKPVVLVCFQEGDVLLPLKKAVTAASSVVLAHSDSESLQHYVADVLLGKVRVDGRLSVPLGDLFAAGTGVTLDPNHPRDYKPEDFNMNSEVLAYIDTIAREGLQAGAYPGCHVLIMRYGYPVYNKCFGTHTYEGKQPVRENDLYDLASLSKASGTLLAVMKLYDEGKFGLTDKVAQYLPFLQGTNKSRITIQDLLLHESGLPAYWPFYEEVINMKSCKGGLFSKHPDATHTVQVASNLYACTDFELDPRWASRTPSPEYPLQAAKDLYIKKEFRQVMLKKIAEMPLKGKSYRYSCLNFVLLKEIVEHVAGVALDTYLDSVFYKPMGLTHTTYHPLKHFRPSEIVPTVQEDFLRGGPLCGYVHDEMAALQGGVSGNAGLFSTAREVGVIWQMLLDRGVCGDRRYLSRATCDLFITLKSKNSRRGLGFDKPDVEHPENSPCAEGVPASVFGHTGFTGTCAWVDPDNELVFVFLSNRIYPNPCGRDALMKLNIRPRIQQTMYQSLTK